MVEMVTVATNSFRTFCPLREDLMPLPRNQYQPDKTTVRKGMNRRQRTGIT